jgi:prepilin-type N-terminal cleavage/methylation domain-containing protein
MKNILNNKKGFTLIELLVVISIISLLTSIILSSLSDAKAKGRDAAKIRAMIETRSALQMHFSDKGYYPQLISNLASTYIKTVNSEISYIGTTLSDGTGGDCGTYGPTCLGYRIGIKLEKRNTVLNSDKDTNITTGNTAPDGISTSANCAPDDTTTVATDLCYDLSS